MIKKLGLCFMIIALTISVSDAFFFGSGGGGGGCSCAAPICPPPPVCQSAPACAPQISCGGSLNTGGYLKNSYSQPSYPQLEPKPSYEIRPQPQILLPQRLNEYVANAPVHSSYSSGYVPQKLSYENNLPNNNKPSYALDSNNILSSSAQSAVKVPPSEIFSNGQAAGQKIQEIVDENEEIIVDAKAEENLNQDEFSSTAATNLNLKNTDETIPVIELIDIAKLNLTENSECNSEDLRKILLDNIEENLNSAKRVIQLNAESKFGGRFDVICSNNDFSYVTNTELYCQETKKSISCYAYRQL